MNGFARSSPSSELLGLSVLLCCLLSLLPVGHASAKERDPLSPATFALDLDERDDTGLFVVGNVLFAAYHELGHALIDLLDLPVVGREEDAADGFAAVMMIPPKPDPVRDELIIAVADGWRLQSERALAFGHAPLWAEHGLDEQRYFSVICWMVGSDQEGFFEFALEAGMPEQRIETCAGEFDRMRASWQDLLDGHGADAELVRDVNDRPIAVVYETPRQGDVEALQWARLGGVIERSILDFAGNIGLPEDITVRFKSCDDANAYWFGERLDVVICYGLVDDFLSALPDGYSQ